MYKDFNNYCLKYVKPNTKKSIWINSLYRNSDRNNRELYNVFSTYSSNKESAMQYCKKMQYALNGCNGRIVSHNTFIFTYAFEFENPEDGVLYIAYITPNYDYCTEEQ